MIEFKTGDILQEDAEALVNTVNCVGVMGRGIALQFKHAFPENFRAYVAACKRSEVQPGQMFVYETGLFTNPRYIINFPTKRHWREKSLMEDIESGLQALVAVINQRHIQSIAIPPLGSGLGGLDWAQVQPCIEKAMLPLTNVRIIIYRPEYVPQANELPHDSSPPIMSEGRSALIALAHHYLQSLLDPYLTLLELHKLMYFMQIAGEPLRLNYIKHVYGPYAENLRHVLNRMEGHFISGYSHKMGDTPDQQLYLLPGAIEKANTALKEHPKTKERLECVIDLVEGFESPFGLELLATVHWVATQEGITSMDELIHKVYAWSKRKQQFTARQIELAAGILIRKGWITTQI